MIQTVDVRHARIVMPREMTDEQLATADELITETMAETRANPALSENQAALLMNMLVHQRAKIRDEAKHRMAIAYVALRAIQ